MKLTKRKGFNFFRSYFDVYNELENDADKVAFMDALLERQFMGIKPKNLKGMAKFAYISQTNSIDNQVKGYEDKTKTRLDGSVYYKDGFTPTEGVKNTPTEGGCNTPSEQEKEEEKEKEELSNIKVEAEDDKVINISYSEEDFIKNWNEVRTYFLGTPSNINKLKPEEGDLFFQAKNEFDKQDFHKALNGLFKQEKIPRDIMWFRPKHFLDNIDVYIDANNNKRFKLYA